MAIISIIELSEAAQKRVRSAWHNGAAAVLVKPRGQGRWQVHAIEAPATPCRDGATRPPRPRSTAWPPRAGAR